MSSSTSPSHPPPPLDDAHEAAPIPTFHFPPTSLLGRIETLFTYLESPSSFTFFPVLIMYLLTFLAGSFSLARELWTKPYEESLVWSNAWAAAIVWLFYDKTRRKWETRREWLRERREEEEESERRVEEGGVGEEVGLVEEKEDEKREEVC